jgi:hypothetical protein
VAGIIKILFLVYYKIPHSNLSSIAPELDAKVREPDVVPDVCTHRERISTHTVHTHLFIIVCPQLQAADTRCVWVHGLAELWYEV